MAEQGKPMNFGEKTSAQVITTFGRELVSPLAASFTTYRTMRKQPTLALTRAMIAAPIMAGTWTVEVDDDVENADEVKKFVMDQFQHLRERVMEASIYGMIDFGDQPWEVVFEAQDYQGKQLVVIKKLKALLQDLTTILVNVDTGEFLGYKQTSAEGKATEIEARYTLHMARGVEGTNWYGIALLENARDSYNQWREANEGAERYDAKLAGTHFVIHYPVGTTPIDGVETDNAEVAEDILSALESAGSIVVPQVVSSFVKELSNENPTWKLEIMEDANPRQPSFIERLKYLDTMMVRSLLMPERAITEGQFGTKAEAGTHGDLAVILVTQWDRRITKDINEQVLDTLLDVNWGSDMRGKARLVSTPLVDEVKDRLAMIYDKLLTNPSALLEEFPTIDTNAIKDILEVPKTREVANAGGSEQPPEGLDPAQRERMSTIDPGFEIQ